MDFVAIIDRVGEPVTALLVGALLGSLFGGLVFATGFCTRSAILDIIRPARNKNALAIWLVALAAAIGGTQVLIALGGLDISQIRFFAAAQSLSGAVVGGLLFGAGMILARGCASRLLVLGAAGNLRAVASVSVIAATAWATYQGALVPLRDMIGTLATTAQLQANSVGGQAMGVIAAMVLAAIAAWLLISKRAHLTPSHWVGGAFIGALVPAAWYMTSSLSQQVFEPIQIESLSFMRPLAGAAGIATSGGAHGLVSLDSGLIMGTVLGAFVMAIVTGRFRIETFSAPGTPHFARYMAGSVLMGFGGILAAGCTIGAGFAGTSVLALSSVVALLSLTMGAVFTDWLVDQRAGKRAVAFNAVPAE